MSLVKPAPPVVVPPPQGVPKKGPFPAPGYPVQDSASPRQRAPSSPKHDKSFFEPCLAALCCCCLFDACL